MRAIFSEVIEILTESGYIEYGIHKFKSHDDTEFCLFLRDESTDIFLKVFGGNRSRPNGLFSCSVN